MLYVKFEKDKLLVVVYVDYILFRSEVDHLNHQFVVNMKFELDMSMLGEISYFLGLQITSTTKGIFISQGKYLKEFLKKWRDVFL